MSHRNVLLLLAITAIVPLSACEDDPEEPGDDEEFIASPLTGAAERPNPTNSTASGSATFDFDDGVMTYSLSVTGVTPTAAHIHGPADANNPAGVIVGLQVGTNRTFTATGHATINMDSLLVLMRNGQSYVNVHSAAFPNGEIRGQIQRR